MKNSAKEVEEFCVFNRPFGDIVKIMFDDHRTLTNSGYYEKNPITKTKRIFLQTKRIYPLESIQNICQRVGIKNYKVVLGWCKKDEDFRWAYQSIINRLNGYLKELYDKNRIDKRTK
jgi:hypothetical protein